MSTSALRIGAALILILTVLGLADFFLKEYPHELAMKQEEAPTSAASSSSAMSVFSSIPVATMSGWTVSSASSAIIGSGSGTSSSEPLVIKKGVSTKKKSSVDVHTTLATLQLIEVQTTETSILNVIAQNMTTQTVVLLTNNDRAALFSWVENDDVKTLFSLLKQTLQEQFSPKLSGLVDETRTQESGPPVDVLSFFDPAISPEKILFVRVRNRLYEFHIAAKGSDIIDRLVEELSK